MSDLRVRIEALEHLSDLLARYGYRLDARVAEALLRMPREQLWAVEALVAAALAGRLDRGD